MLRAGWLVRAKRKLLRRVVNFSYQIVRAWIIFCQKAGKSIPLYFASYWINFFVMEQIRFCVARKSLSTLDMNGLWKRAPEPERGSSISDKKIAFIVIMKCFERIVLCIISLSNKIPCNLGWLFLEFFHHNKPPFGINSDKIELFNQMNCCENLFVLHSANKCSTSGGLECWRKLPALNKLVLEKFWWMEVTQVCLKRCENFEVGCKKGQSLRNSARISPHCLQAVNNDH